MSILENLKEDMKSAMRSGDKLELGAVRLAIAAIRKREIDDQHALADDEIVAVLRKLIKQGQDSAQQYEAAGRAELAAKEVAEVAVFERYLPRGLSDAELDALIREAIAETGASDMKAVGKVMGLVKSKAAGRADMGAVNARVRAILSDG